MLTLGALGPVGSKVAGVESVGLGVAHALGHGQQQSQALLARLEVLSVELVPEVDQLAQSALIKSWRLLELAL
ncbi:hypothetical protein D9M70_649960 [compost metagenome]